MRLPVLGSFFLYLLAVDSLDVLNLRNSSVQKKKRGGKINGQQDSVVTDMIKELPQEKIYETTKCVQARVMEQEGAPNSSGRIKERDTGPLRSHR